MVTIYFSGTGNTKFIAKNFSEFMGCEFYSIEEDIDFRKAIEENNIIALCYPIHFSKAPVLFMEFISKYKDNFKGKKIISLCSQQFYSGDGARSIIDLLEEVDVIYAEHLNMHNNITCMPNYYKITKINNKKCLRKTRKKIFNISKDIKRGKIKLKGFNKLSMSIGRTQHLSDESIKEKQQKAVRVNENCILCKKCVNLCPSKNLLLGSKIISKENCTFCMRCVNICPKQAITVLLHGKVKEQYYISDEI